jgi:hypothetical protein
LLQIFLLRICAKGIYGSTKKCRLELKEGKAECMGIFEKISRREVKKSFDQNIGKVTEML